MSFGNRGNPHPPASMKPGEHRGCNAIKAAETRRVKHLLTEALQDIGRELAVDTPYATLTKIEAVAQTLWNMALNKDLGAIKEIFERLDGKVKQVTVLNGDEDGGAVRFERIERIIIRADASNTNGGSVPALPAASAV